MARHETEALWALAADALEPSERARVEGHVTGCEECTRKLAEVRKAQALLHSVREGTPEVRWAQVDERIQSAAARRLARLERKAPWPWAFAAVTALAAVLVFGVFRSSVSPAPQPGPAVAAREESPAPVTPTVREEPAPAPAPAPVIATHVESASGAWIREPDAPERSLQAGTQLRSGVSVRTRAKSSALLRLPDASRVRLSPDSEVTLARTEAQDVRLTVTRGRLAVRASHVARQGFTVEAAGVRASVVGTVFSVERTARGAVVAVLEGKVRVEAEGQPPRFVSAGERLEVDSHQQAPKARALSTQDRQAFQELELPPAETASISHPATPSGGSGTPHEPAPAVAVAAPSAQEVPTEAAPAEPPAPSSAAAESPPSVAAKAAPSGSEESGSEFAPYPVPTSPEPMEPGVLAPSSGTTEARQGFAPQSPWAPPQPGVSQPGTADARFLWHAREQLSATTCESFLVGLAEIAERSTVRDFREQARYLRARCFEERVAPAEAAAEYRRYLREFPKGRYAREAKAALLP